MLKPILQFNPLFVLVFLCASLHAQQTNINVSGGQFSEPYFNFSDENGSIDLDTFEFIAGRSYKFTAIQGFSPHPFQIGSSPGTPSQYLIGGPLSSVGDELVLEIPSNFDPYSSSSSLHFYCTAHTSMNGQLTVVAAGGSEHNNNNDGNNEPSESLDGSVIHITGEDSVKETLIFENGTVTSIFDEGEGQTPFTTEDLSYSIEDDASGHLVIIDGDLHYLFYESNGTGNLLDYSNNGQLDESGSWGFSYVIHEWEEYDDFSSGSLDPNKWDLWWGEGGSQPEVENGALKLSGSGDINNPASSVIPEDLTFIPLQNLPSKHSLALINQDDIYGIQAEFMIPDSPSDDTGLNFIFFDWSEDGSSKQEFGPELEYRSQNGLRTEFAYTDPATGESEQITRSAEFGTYYKMSLVHTDSMNSMYLNGELIKEFSSTGFAPDTIGFAAFNDDGLPYVTYVKNVRVLRRQGENSGHDDGNETNSPGDGDSIVQDSNGTWENYDDFSTGTLASDKWETGYWDGAQAPEVVDGKARLSSNGSGVGSQEPSFMDDLVGMPDNGSNHSFLSITDSSVIGVEAEISLSSTSSIETGLYLGIFEELDSGSGFAFAGIELGYWDQSGPSITFDNSIYENGEETFDEVLQERTATLGENYRISVVEGENNYQLFLDDQLVQEYPIRGELLSFHFGAFHDLEESFETFVTMCVFFAVRVKIVGMMMLMKQLVQKAVTQF